MSYHVTFISQHAPILFFLKSLGNLRCNIYLLFNLSGPELDKPMVHVRLARNCKLLKMSIAWLTVHNYRQLMRRLTRLLPKEVATGKLMTDPCPTSRSRVHILTAINSQLGISIKFVKSSMSYMRGRKMILFNL